MSTAWMYLLSRGGEDPRFQERWALATAAKHGWKITNVLHGAAATGDDRAGALSLAERIRSLPDSERPARLLVLRLDQLARDPVDAVVATVLLGVVGVVVHTSTERDCTPTRALRRLSDSDQSSLPHLWALVELERSIRTRTTRDQRGHQFAEVVSLDAMRRAS